MNNIGTQLHDFYESLNLRQRTRTREIVNSPPEWNAVIEAAAGKDDTQARNALTRLRAVFERRKSEDFFGAGFKLMQISGILGADKSQTFLAMIE